MLWHVLLLCLLCLGPQQTTFAANDNGSNDKNNKDKNEPTTLADRPDYLIVGAGGAGIQMALYMEKFNFSYKILEKSQNVGNHFLKFPRFDELISINKRVRNENNNTEWHYRFDWHSFLETPIRMYANGYSKAYFPRGKDWQLYMEGVAKETGILQKIEFDTNVVKIADSDNRPCVVLATGNEICAKRRVFVGTGLVEKKEPLLKALGAIPYSLATKEMAEGKRVCILGNGNSGFELAQNVFDVSELVLLNGRAPAKFSAVTRYTGDVRFKYLQVLENFNTKALDTVDYFPKNLVHISGLEKMLNATQIEVVTNTLQIASWLYSHKCEVFFTATGFDSNVPAGTTMKPPDYRFPITNDWYQSIDNSNVHFIGWLQHERDFRSGSGGFLSGFRYLIRNLAYHVRQEDTNIPYPHLVFHSKQDVIAKVIQRVQTADDIFILQNGVTVRDVIVPVAQYGNKLVEYHYYEGITHDFHPDLIQQACSTDSNHGDVIYLYFEWGRSIRMENALEGLVRYSDTGALMNVLLHPIIEIGCNHNLVRQFMEDEDMGWTDMEYRDSIVVNIRGALDGDYSRFTPKDIRPYAYTPKVENQTNFGYYEPVNRKAPVDNRVVQALWKAVYTNGRPKEMQALRQSMYNWRPILYEPHNMLSTSSSSSEQQ